MKSKACKCLTIILGCMVLTFPVMIYGEKSHTSLPDFTYFYEVQSVESKAPAKSAQIGLSFANIKDESRVIVPNIRDQLPTNGEELALIPFNFNSGCCGGCDLCSSCGVSTCGCMNHDHYADSCCCGNEYDECCCECGEEEYGYGSGGAGITGGGASSGFGSGFGSVGGSGSTGDDGNGDDTGTTGATDTGDTTTTTTTTTVIIPEPSTYLMLGTTLAIAIVLRQMRKKAKGKSKQ